MIESVLALLNAATGDDRRTRGRLLVYMVMTILADFMIVYTIIQGLTRRRQGLSADGNALMLLLAVGAYYMVSRTGYQEGARLFAISTHTRTARLSERLLR